MTAGPSGEGKGGKGGSSSNGEHGGAGGFDGGGGCGEHEMQRRGGYGGDGGGTAGASTRNSTSSKPGSGDGDGNDPKRVVTFVWHSASHAYTRKLHGSNNPGLLCRQPAYSTEHAVKHGLAIKLPPSQIASRPIIASDTQQPVQHMGVCAHSGDGFQRYIFI